MADLQGPDAAKKQLEENTTVETEINEAVKVLVDELAVTVDKLGRPRPGVDERFYILAEKEADFFKEQTGIQDDEELKEHIIKVQTEAYAVGVSNDIHCCVAAA